jgi:exopolyphosphatase / guanosine-5'-triphosphate,3'-diphosphate pyrophosphatase
MTRQSLGVVDIGSNTIRSLIVDVLPDGSYRVRDDEREVARLASGLTRQGRLSRPAMRRAVKALRRMAEIARARGVRRMSVVATSAIRNARNRRVFVDRVRRETGLRVRVVSETEEARLAFESAAQSFDLAEHPCAVADVGGGSTELVLALGNHIQRDYSFHLGAVALTEEFVHSDPLRRRDFKALRHEVRRQIRAAGIEVDPAPQFVIASGGTATAVAQMAMARQGLEKRPVQGFEMSQAELLHLRNALLRRTLAERRRLPGLSPDRADIIIAGITILYEILSHLKVNVLRISARGIRHAVLNRMIARRPGTPSGPFDHRRRLLAAEALARSFRSEQPHAEQVRRIAMALFDQLSAPLDIDPGARDLLAAASLLHDVGYVVGYRQHHKHAYHLIAHAPLDGFTPREREIIALVARYHRRSGPKKRHRAWATLPRDDRDLVRQLSALLRIADALDRRHTGQLREVRCEASRRRVRMLLLGRGDLGIERHAAEAKSKLFRTTFGREVRFRARRLRLVKRRLRVSRPREGALAAAAG